MGKLLNWQCGLLCSAEEYFSQLFVFNIFMFKKL